MFTHGQTLAWHVLTTDPHGAQSGWAGPCYLTVDTTPPDRKPIVTSTDYPEGRSSGAPGKTGRFTFNANGLADAAGFAYRVGGQGWRQVDAPGGSATVDVTPVTADGTRLDVAIVDKAGNQGVDNELDPSRSNVRKYEIRVNGPTPPTGHWRLDGRNNETAAPDSTGRHPGTVANGGWGHGRNGDAVSLSGNAGSEVPTRNGPAVDATRSYTVSAWVKLRDHPGDIWKTAVSQDGERVSRFALQYAGSGIRKWAFSMMSHDNDGPAIEQAVATDPKFTPRTEVWTHLTGVYNSTYGTLQLYVNGELAGTGQHTGNWTSQPARTLQIGRGKWAGNTGDNFPGLIDDVKVFDRALPDIRLDTSGSEIDQLAGRPANEIAAWNFDDATGTVTTDFTGQQTAMTLSAGIGWAPGKTGTGARFPGNGGRVYGSEPVIRTDDSFTVSAWVKPDVLDAKARAVAAQEGVHNSGFYLMYRNDSGKPVGEWTMTVPNKDAASPELRHARASVPARVGEWTHVAGVYDDGQQEIRVYVNGVLSGTGAVPGGMQWNAPGPFQVGNAKWDGKHPLDFLGTIDEVRVFDGVRTGEEITDEAANPVPSRVKSKAHTRYASPKDQFSFNGPTPAGYFKAGDLGYYPPPGTPGTHMLYSCRLGTDGFTSTRADCEGAKLISPLGPVYDTAGEGRTGLYRCLHSGRYFDSLVADCEGQTVVVTLGYTLPYVTLQRYQSFEGAPDSRSDVGFAPLTYRHERDLVAVHHGPRPGQIGLYLCKDGTDTYAAIDAQCGGKQLLKATGWLWVDKPADPAATRLYSCTRIGTPDRFESTDQYCEGQDVVGPLGYGIDPARVTS
nr:LamG domain-containing protein [Kibdelosporangium phytohabitans]